MRGKNILLWALWLLLTLLLAWYLLSRLYGEAGDKTVFLPGATTDGHYQIELACNACHTGPYADRDALQEACEGCHADALKAAKDDHPKAKFSDPRNADRVALLDARYCVTCHVEHRPDITGPMAVSVPADTCFLCHEAIGDERPSHAGMAFDTCTSAGCHNFHDNRALYEDFLVKHMDDAPTLFDQQLLVGNLAQIAEQLPDYPLDAHPVQALDAAGQVYPEHAGDAEIVRQWAGSAHARSGAGCQACHADTAGGDWVDSPDHTACASCHKGEVDGFLQGRHGMRLDTARLGRELSPMDPALARLPMREDAAGRELGCQSCHGAHDYSLAESAVQSCLGCHADEHSLAYRDSAHYRLWQRERAGDAPAGSGVTCASCHMPRIERDYYWGTFVHHEVQHNQSANLQPNEKMIRPVCLQCHGLGFAIDALADEALIRANFNAPPAVHIRSIDLARQRLDADADTPAH
ncbi:MAG: NrfA- nitrite reduction protein [Halioglobus sp.]|nr:NrfA- nitrite reduction protein [Halioglobus sp.]